MDKTAPASELDRRKQVKIRLRQDLDIQPQKYEGRTYWVVKDPVSLRYYRFKEQEHFLLQMMDGKHTLDDAQKSFEKRFRPDRLTLEDLEQFGQQLLQAGLVQNEAPKCGKQIFERRKKRKRREWMQTFTNILYIKIPVFDPDRLLTWMLQYTRWMFTLTFLFISIAVMLSAVLLVATHFQTFRDKLPSYHEFFSFKTVIYLWVALGFVKVIHEFGHGLSCKAFGGEVHEMGLLFLCFSPCLYCNVSDSWTLPNKWHRIIIAGAGIYVELVIAALATFVWWNTPAHPFINNLALNTMVVCSVSTVVFNANPLMRYDGYYMLADWLEIPNLRERSNRYLTNLFLDRCLGIEVQPEPYMAPWRRVLFVSYAIVSYIYRWVVTFSILYFMGSILGPKLKVLSQLMTLFAAGSMVGWPIYRLGNYLWKRGRVPDMKQFRVAVTATVAAVVVLVFFLVPLPVSRVRQLAVVQVMPQQADNVFVPVPGVLEELRVREGQEVRAGDVLAVLSSRELDAQLLEAQREELIRRRELEALDRQIASTFDRVERDRLRATEARLIGERNGFLAQDRHYQSLQDKLTLLAPRSGKVLKAPRINDVGKLWDTSVEEPFAIIGDPGHIRAVMPIVPSDLSLLQEALRDFKDGPAVTIRVHGRGLETWSGRLLPLPESEAKEVPTALTHKAGGPLAVKPGQRPGVNVPQNQVYLVSVEFQNPDQAIAPGALAQVKVHCRWRSAAWWTWRTICDLFDLQLM